MGSPKDKANTNGRQVRYLLATSKRGSRVVMVSGDSCHLTQRHLKILIDTKANTSTTLNTAKALSPGKLATDTLVSTLMTSEKAGARWSGLMEVRSEVSGRREFSTDSEL